MHVSLLCAAAVFHFISWSFAQRKIRAENLVIQGLRMQRPCCECSSDPRLSVMSWLNLQMQFLRALRPFHHLHRFRRRQCGRCNSILRLFRFIVRIVCMRAATRYHYLYPTGSAQLLYMHLSGSQPTSAGSAHMH